MTVPPVTACRRAWYLREGRAVDFREFIQSREALVRAGTLTRFHESELSESTMVFGNVAHRFSAYAKSGTSSGTPFKARGMVTTQFINTPSGWKVSSMAG